MQEDKIAEKKKHAGLCQPGAGVMTSGLEGKGQPCIVLTLRVCSTYSKNEEMLLEAREHTGAQAMCFQMS